MFSSSGWRWKIYFESRCLLQSQIILFCTEHALWKGVHLFCSLLVELSHVKFSVLVHEQVAGFVRWLIWIILQPLCLYWSDGNKLDMEKENGKCLGLITTINLWQWRQKYPCWIGGIWYTFKWTLFRVKFCRTIHESNLKNVFSQLLTFSKSFLWSKKHACLGHISSQEILVKGCVSHRLYSPIAFI